MKETRDFNLEIKDLSETGTFEGLAAGYGNVDRHGDVIAPGCFAASLLEHQRRGTMPALLLHHDIARPAGTWLDLRETPDGLMAKGRLALDAQDGREAYALLSAKAITGLSVGFSNAQRMARGGRTEIVAGELLEVSLVAVPANPAAVVSRIKSAPTPRVIEEALIGAGLSNRQAKAAAALVSKHLAQSGNQETEAAAQRLAAIINEARTGLAQFKKRI